MVHDRLRDNRQTQAVHDRLSGRTRQCETFGYRPRRGGCYDSREDRSPSPEPPGPQVFSKAIHMVPFPPRFRASTTITKYSGETKLELWLVDYRLACQLGGGGGRVMTISLFRTSLPFSPTLPEHGSCTSRRRKSTTRKT
jgi:hypothetical protein